MRAILLGVSAACLLATAGFAETPTEPAPGTAAAYDLAIQQARQRIEAESRMLANVKARLAAFGPEEPDNPQRLQALNSVDLITTQLRLTELLELALRNARDKAGTAEAERAAALVESAERARADYNRWSIWSGTRLQNEIARLHSDQPGGLTVSPEIERLELLRQRARLESLNYAAVRDAVDVGQRGSSDLTAAAAVLKTAQLAVYDAEDAIRDRMERGFCRSTTVGADGKPRLGPAKPAKDCLPPRPARPEDPVLPSRG